LVRLYRQLIMLVVLAYPRSARPADNLVGATGPSRSRLLPIVAAFCDRIACGEPTQLRLIRYHYACAVVLSSSTIEPTVFTKRQITGYIAINTLSFGIQVRDSLSYPFVVIKPRHPVCVSVPKK
jgi:hypothetical protein